MTNLDEANSGSNQGSVRLTRADDRTLLIKLSGAWHLTRDVPSGALLRKELESVALLKGISFDTSELAKWDSRLIAFLVQTSAACRAHGIDQDRRGLPEGLRRLLELAEAVPEKKGARSEAVKAHFFQRVGNVTIGYSLSVGDFMAFLGDLTVAFGKFVRGKARLRRVDFVEVIQECGAEAAG